MQCRVVDLRCKEVINIHDGCRLGFPCDVEVEMPCGQILAIIVQGPCRFWGLFGKGIEYIIPWDCIKRIGADIILVEHAIPGPKPPKDKKRFW